MTRHFIDDLKANKDLHNILIFDDKNEKEIQKIN